MPLGKLARGRDRDHDPRPHVFAEAALDVCAQRVRGAPGETSFDQTTCEELSQHPLDDGTQGAVGAGEPLGPDTEELTEVMTTL